ncbi:hypothetical protein Hdeb2414_s0008g00288411 [Helianthus debilis subsp. tardiflorus]
MSQCDPIDAGTGRGRIYGKTIAAAAAAATSFIGDFYPTLGEEKINKNNSFPSTSNPFTIYKYANGYTIYARKLACSV